MILSREIGASRPLPLGITELFGCAAFICFGLLLYLSKLIDNSGAAVLTTAFLVVLLLLAWKRFDAGCHPCFLVLSTLILFQAGHLIGYCVGEVEDPFLITLMTANPFRISRDSIGVVLLSISIAAFCIYLPCAWRFRPQKLSSNTTYQRYLPYLYFVWCCSIPIQLYRNYQYLRYAQNNGGYLVFFIDHSGLSASIPFVVRAVSLVTFPVFISIFVLETRKKYLYLTVALYFITASFILLMGSRGAIFGIALSLWYVARMKSTKPKSGASLVVVALVLIVTGAVIGSTRTTDEETNVLSSPVRFIAEQGASLNVTELAVEYKSSFHRHVLNYLSNELKSAFVSGDQGDYHPGQRMNHDLAMLLNPEAYRMGFGSGSAYIAEAYVVGGVFGVIVASLLIGLVLRIMRWASQNALGLIFVAMMLPDFLWLPRAGLLDWTSVVFRNLISIAILILGWMACRIFRVGMVVQGAQSGAPFLRHA